MSIAGHHPVEQILGRLRNPRLPAGHSPIVFSPSQITAVYLLVGFGALFVSDVLLPQTIRDPAVLAQVQALKGGVEIVVSAGVIFGLTTWSHTAIEARNDRLSSLHAERNLLHRVFRHNLRQDLCIINGYADLIDEDVRAELHEYCANIQNRADGIEDTLEKIIRLEKILEPPHHHNTIDLVALINGNRKLEEVTYAEKVTVSTHLPETAMVRAIPSIGDAVTELIENAVEHADQDHDTIEIEVRIEEPGDGMVGLVVSDAGPGIPAFERAAIEEFQEQDLTHSSGIGLWLAQLACRESGGRLEIGESSMGGTRVQMWLPAADA